MTEPDPSPSNQPNPDGQTSNGSPTPDHPPVLPEVVRYEEPAAWPGVIGTICIVFGSLALLQGCAGMLGSLVQALIPLGPAPGADEVRAVMARWLPFMVTSSVLTSGLGGLLLAAGIGLLRRAPWSPRLALLWAVLKALYVPVVAVITVKLQREIMAAVLKSTPSAPPPGMTSMMQFMGAAGIFVSIVWGEALPIFLLIWLNLGRSRREIAHWPRRDP